jgi:hypothetical protein
VPIIHIARLSLGRLFLDAYLDLSIDTFGDYKGWPSNTLTTVDFRRFTLSIVTRRRQYNGLTARESLTSAANK